MKRIVNIMFLFSVIVSLIGGCAYYYPYGYNSADYPNNYGFIAPFYYYSPYGDYPYYYQYGYFDFFPSDRFYLGESPEDFRERYFQTGERPAGEK